MWYRIRGWLGINYLETLASNLSIELNNVRTRLNTLEVELARLSASSVQHLSEHDPRRIAQSNNMNDLLIKKIIAEQKVRDHFGYGPPDKE